MILFPAIDIYQGKAVRLYKGDYEQMTVYSDDPSEIAQDFKDCGARAIHIVDLEGAKNGQLPNFSAVVNIKEETGLFCEIGGGIRSMSAVKRYLDAGMDRVILGTAAIEDEAFLHEAVQEYGKHIAVGADIKDGFIAVRGWVKQSQVRADDFFQKMQKIGIETIICTDISRDGAMRGTNLDLYRDMNARYKINIVASGGVSSMNDLYELNEMGVYGAIIGKAYYIGAIDLREAVTVLQ